MGGSGFENSAWDFLGFNFGSGVYWISLQALGIFLVLINEHCCTIDNSNAKSNPTTAAEHFLSSPNHTANDMQQERTSQLTSLACN